MEICLKKGCLFYTIVLFFSVFKEDKTIHVINIFCICLKCPLNTHKVKTDKMFIKLINKRSLLKLIEL